ncbi:hypothetical protein BAZSYMA_ACONTIG24004_0 [Bathymodiolus azoricus thioautotrophic gill symbiont]|uniref:Uncharacterized protein n=1 Tax=Bathymodiolus azoricus thioautotrophic gill symbiont TaxID=235205 RepID=A0A1H6M6L4_9GAMM|nr:hypothetical protein BAZSYMA_ACONTIG24004_0 [Bathymodiolus azoricus thioautotrophic gill symbiont]
MMIIIMGEMSKSPSLDILKVCINHEPHFFLMKKRRR